MEEFFFLVVGSTIAGGYGSWWLFWAFGKDMAVYFLCW